MSRSATSTSTRAATITTASLKFSNALKLEVGADWPFLHDEKCVIQEDLGIQEYTDPYNDPMVPHTFVSEPGLKIHKIYNGYWYWGRPSTAELHQDLREITRRIRPDYKIDTPEMRKRWERTGWASRRRPSKEASTPGRRGTRWSPRSRSEWRILSPSLRC